MVTTGNASPDKRKKVTDLCSTSTLKRHAELRSATPNEPQATKQQNFQAKSVVPFLS